jgi:hypothetical protein
MSDFNYIEYLKNNPLKGTKTQSTKLITEAQEDTIDNLQKVADDTSKMPADRDEARNKMYAMKAKMSKSELKEKIREEILAALNEEEDYEKMGREVEYGIGGPDDEEELSMEDIFDAYDDEDFEMSIDEAKKDEEVDAEVDVAVEEPAMDAAPDPSQGLSAEEQEIQNSLKIAYDNAAAIGDQKLADQIGNSITFFTRTHIVER